MRGACRVLAYRKSSEPLRQIKALARNAYGLASMYYTDAFLSKEEKVKYLIDFSLPALTADSDIFGRDPSIFCDIASCKMRIAYWAESAGLFYEAEELLREVKTRLWPEYGFAYFELGRIARLQGQFFDAEQHFWQTLRTPEDYRGVTKARIERELRLTSERSSVYP